MSRMCAAAVAVLLGALVVAAPTSAYATDCSPVSEEGDLDHTPWGQDRMGADRVWPLTRGDGVKVAVIDSGVSDANPILDGKVEHGTDYVEPEEGESKVGSGCDLVGHGTSIAGIIAGREDTDTPFAGMAPDADLLSIRVLPDLGVSSDRELPDTLGTAIREAVDSGADVINLSIQLVHSKGLEDAVEYAAKHDVVMVAAAGNQGGEDGDNTPQFPAAYDVDAMLAVSAIKQDGSPTESTNSGTYVDVAAPGDEIAGPGPEGTGYTGGKDATGTSFAAGFVSGTAALVRARFPDLKADEVANRVRATAQSPPGIKDDHVGWGVVDPYRAVTATLGRDELDQTLPGPAVHLESDTQVLPRQAGLVLLALCIVVAIFVGWGRIVGPIMLRRRREKRSDRRLRNTSRA